MNIVPTNVLYNSYLLRQNLILLNHVYPFLNIQVVGNSVLGKPIYVVKLGNISHFKPLSPTFSSKKTNYFPTTVKESDGYWKIRRLNSGNTANKWSNKSACTRSYSTHACRAEKQ